MKYIKILLLTVSILNSSLIYAMDLITSEYLLNTYHIKFNESTGTCFKPLKTKKYSYYVTAKHVIQDLKDGDTIKIYFYKRWNEIKVIKVLHNDKEDVSVFVFDGKDSPRTFQLNMGSAGLIYGQDTFILGFPYGISSNIDKIRSIQSVPTPFVKKGVFSTVFRGEEKKLKDFYVDISINPGFSGGPALFIDMKSKKIKIFGIVNSGYFRKTKFQDKKNIYTIVENSSMGIIKHITIARELIIQAQKELKDTPVLISL